MAEEKRKIDIKRLFMFVVGTIFLIVMGVTCIKIASKEQDRVKDWPTVEAKITGFIEHKKDDRYEHDIYITYIIGDKVHENVKINQFDGTVMKPDAIITVKYNPSNHNEAVYGSPGFNTVPFVVGTAFIVIGAAIPVGYVVSKVVKSKKAKANLESKTEQSK